MNLQAHIQNYRGLASASLDISRICLLAGPNAAGKTSAAQAISGALTGEPVPIKGVKKTSAGLLVRSGTASGSVSLTTTEGRTEIQWPSAKVKTEGQAPYSSHFAAGLQTIVTLDEKERVKILTEYLKASPIRADLEAQLVSMALPKNILDQLWQLIETTGWDNVCSQTKEKGARYKGQWQQVTGEQYGSKKAESWVPEGYSDDLMGESEDKLSALVTDARDALESAIAADAVDDSARNQLELLAGLLQGRRIDALAAENDKPDTALNHQLEECTQFIASINVEKDVLTKQLSELPSANQAIGMCCPKCTAELEVKAGKLVVLTGQLTSEEIQSRKEAIAALKTKIDAVSDGVQKHMEAAARLKRQIQEVETTHHVKLAECHRLVKESETAADELKKPVAGRSEVSVDDCRTTYAKAELRLKAYQAKYAADRLHHTIGQNAELLAKLSPEGIRGYVQVKALKQFNDSVSSLCKTAGWRPVTLESDFMPTYGGTQYELLSESEKFRVRVVLQIGMALTDKSQALVIDAADILDKGGRNGLFKAVKSTGLSTFISMTIDSKELVPNLAKAGIGTSYWINGDATAEAIA